MQPVPDVEVRLERTQVLTTSEFVGKEQRRVTSGRCEFLGRIEGKTVGLTRPRPPLLVTVIVILMRPVRRSWAGAGSPPLGKVP